MKKIVQFFATAIATTANLSASWYDSPSCANPSESTLWPSGINLECDVGYRRDEFKWTNSGLDDTPNVFNDVNWKELNIVQVGAAASYVSCRNYAIRINGDYGHIYNGRSTVTDYLGDDKTLPIIRTVHDAGKGSVYDIEGGVGYRVTSTCGRFVAVPLVGWTFSGQNLHSVNGHIEFPFTDLPLPYISLDGVDNTYKTRWFGPWVGLDFTAQVERCAYLFGSFEWQFLSYRGEGHRRRRTDFLGPYHHKAHGFGYVVRLGGNWEIWDNWSIGVIGQYRNFKTRHGTEKFILNTELFGELHGKTTFNGAKWQAISVSGLIAYRF